MSSMIISIKTTNVLLNELGLKRIPISISRKPLLRNGEYVSIKNDLYRNGILKMIDGTVRPDKGLDKFLLPIANSTNIIAFQFMKNDVAAFNATVYLSKGKAVALLQQHDDFLYITVDTADELMLLIPDIGYEYDSLCFIEFDKDSTKIHSARYYTTKICVTEIKKNGDEVQETEQNLKLDEYLHTIFREVKEVFECVHNT